MASKSMIDALNNQINHEILSGYLYLSMASYADSINFSGFAHWLKLQAKEELNHAMKIYGYVNDCGGKVDLKAIEQPETQFKSLKEIFEKVLAHEKKITALINKLYELAVKESDYATQINMQWFVSEQVEEEKNASAILEQLKNVGDSYQSLMMIDRNLAIRQ
jgi:ferritin